MGCLFDFRNVFAEGYTKVELFLQPFACCSDYPGDISVYWRCYTAFQRVHWHIQLSAWPSIIGHGWLSSVQRGNEAALPRPPYPQALQQYLYRLETRPYEYPAGVINNIAVFSARCVLSTSRYCHHVRSSVCLSRAGVHCDYTVHVSADLSLWLDNPMFWAPATW